MFVICFDNVNELTSNLVHVLLFPLRRKQLQRLRDVVRPTPTGFSIEKTTIKSSKINDRKLDLQRLITAQFG